MNFPGSYFCGPLGNALGWTLIHSLWQGLAIGGIAMLLLKFRSKATPQFKYLVGLLAMSGILASSVLTFCLEYSSCGNTPGTILSSPSIISVQESILSESGAVPGFTATVESGWIQAVRQAVSSLTPWMTAFWLLGVCILSARLTGGMILVGRLRRHGLRPIPASWEDRLKELIRKSRIGKKVNFMLSARIRVPTVIGILRPVVLIPAGIISLMPVEQLESILAHEIAHIRRYDFLVNILQSVIEALFFYHPVVWLLSGTVRREREKCCDDLAVTVCGKLSVYARALSGLSEFQLAATIPSVALSGNRNRISDRVERLINQKKMKTNASEKILAGLLILGSAAILTFSTGAKLSNGDFQQETSLRIDLQSYARDQGDNPAEPAEPSESVEPSGLAEPAEPAEPSVSAVPYELAEPSISAEPVSVPSDTTLKRGIGSMDIKDNVVTREFIDKDGKEQEIRFVIREGSVREMYVNGEEIPESEFKNYEKEIDRTMRDLKEMDRELRDARKEIAGIDWEEMQKDLQAEMEHFRQHEWQEIQQELQKLQQEKLDIEIDREKLEFEIQKAMADIEIDREKIQQEMMKMQEEAKRDMEKYKQGKYALTEEEFEKMQQAMTEAMEKIEAINQDEMREIFEKELQAIREIDHEKIQREIEMAMKELEKINFAEIEKSMQESLKTLELEKFHFEKERRKLDEMIEELEKLELNK